MFKWNGFRRAYARNPIYAFFPSSNFTATLVIDQRSATTVIHIKRFPCGNVNTEQIA
jgi:hypothetical protein